MWGNSNTIYWKSSIKFKWSTRLKGLDYTIQWTGVWIFSWGIWLHFLDLGFHIVKRQTASRSKESWYWASTWNRTRKPILRLKRLGYHKRKAVKKFVCSAVKSFSYFPFTLTFLSFTNMSFQMTKRLCKSNLSIQIVMMPKAEKTWYFLEIAHDKAISKLCRQMILPVQKMKFCRNKNIYIYG